MMFTLIGFKKNFFLCHFCLSLTISEGRYRKHWERDRGKTYYTGPLTRKSNHGQQCVYVVWSLINRLPGRPYIEWNIQIKSFIWPSVERKEMTCSKRPGPYLNTDHHSKNSSLINGMHLTRWATTASQLFYIYCCDEYTENTLHSEIGCVPVLSKIFGLFLKYDTCLVDHTELAAEVKEMFTRH